MNKKDRLRNIIGDDFFLKLSPKKERFLLEIIDIDGVHLKEVAEFLIDSPNEPKKFKDCVL